MPSAVNIANIGRAVVPDNSRSMDTLARGLGAGVNKFKKYRSDKKKAERTESLVDQIYSGKDEVIDGAQQKVEDEGSFMAAEYTPEQQQADLQGQQINLQEQQQKLTVKQNADQNRENARQNFNLQSIMGDETSMKAFIRLREIDPNAAAGLLDVAKLNSAQESAFVKREAAEALGNWTNIRNMTQNGNHDGARALALNLSKSRTANGQDASRVNAYLNIPNQDEAAGYANTMFATSGGAVEAMSAIENLNLKETQLDIQKKQRELNQIDGGIGGDISNPSPKDFTVSSIAEYQKTGDAADLVRFHSASDKRGQKIIDSGLSAAQTIPILNRSLDLLESVSTGGYDQAALKAKQMFGVESADEAELSNNLGKAVISQYKATFGSQFTEKEGQKLDAIEAGLGKSTAGNKRVINQLIKMSELKIKHAKSRAENLGDISVIDEIDDYLNFDLTPEVNISEMSDSALFD